MRPRALDGPGEIARAALRAIGIRPGVAVFEASTAATERIVRNDCIRVWSIDASGRAHVVAPPDDRCATRGIRLAVPWSEGLLRSLILRSPPGVAEAAIGDWVCHAPRFAALRSRKMELVWTAPWVERATGREGVANNALVEWSCDPPRLERRILHPSDAVLRDLPAGG